MRKTYTPNELRELVRHRLGAFYRDESAAALSYAADVIEAAQKVIDERAGDRPESVTDEVEAIRATKALPAGVERLTDAVLDRIFIEGWDSAESRYDRQKIARLILATTPSAEP